MYKYLSNFLQLKIHESRAEQILQDKKFDGATKYSSLSM